MMNDQSTRRELLEAVSTLTENQNLRVTVKSSMKAAATVGGTTFLGAMMAGPIGIVLGSAVGTFFAYNNTHNFKSVAVILRDDLSEHEKNRLCDAVIETCRSVEVQDVVGLIVLLQTSASLQQMAIQTVIKFLTSEMRMTIID